MAEQPNTEVLHMVLKMIRPFLRELFAAGNASVVPIAFDAALHREHKCQPKGCYDNVRNIFLAQQQKKREGGGGGKKYIVCIGYGCLQGFHWTEHCWLLDPATQARVDVTTDSFSHVYGVPVPSAAHIIAAQPLHAYESTQ